MRPGRGLRITGWVLLPLGSLLLAGALWGRAAYPAHRVPGDGMSPTHSSGTTVYAERVDPSEVRRGDVVLFDLPERYPHAGVLVMQRVIGVGGDRVTCDGRRVLVNGKPLLETYVAGGDPVGDGRPYDVKVPEGRLFLLGDNRGNSLDSRSFQDEGDGGTVPVGAVRERVTDNPAVAVASVFGALVGVAAALTGFGCGLAGWITGRRARRVPPPPPLPYTYV